MKTLPFPAIILTLFCLVPSGCHNAEGHPEEHSEEHAEHQIVVTTPIKQDVINTQQYVCQIHSRRHIEVRALEGGYLQTVNIQEGQAVKEGDLMFKILPTLYQAKLDAEAAEAQHAQLTASYTKKLVDKNVVSEQELALAQAELAKARAKAELARAELNFTDVKAPFDGIIDRQYMQQGSLVDEGDMLTTLSDNDVMWVYFNVPEARYLEYMRAGGKRDPQNPRTLTIPDANIQLELADGSIFEQSAGDTVTVESNFNNMTGNIAFRADFPNPDRILRHGQTGTILIHQTLHDVVVIPQRATYEILDKKFVFVVKQPEANESAAHGGKANEEHASDHAEEHHGEPAAKHQHEKAGEHVAAKESEYAAKAGEHGESSDEHELMQVDGHGVIRQCEITILYELEDIFIVEGVNESDKIVLEGIRQVRDGSEVEYEFREPEEVLSHLKNAAQ